MDTVSKVVNLLLHQYKKGVDANLSKTSTGWNVL